MCKEKYKKKVKKNEKAKRNDVIVINQCGSSQMTDECDVHNTQHKVLHNTNKKGSDKDLIFFFYSQTLSRFVEDNRNKIKKKKIKCCADLI